MLDATQPGASNYQWFESGTALPGETNPTYTVFAAGSYSVTFNLSGTCVADGQIEIEYVAPPVINNNVTLVQCDPDGDGTTAFNLTKALALITNNNPGLTTANFFTSAAPGAAPIANPTAFVSSGQTIFVTFLNTYCPLSATINLVLSNAAVSPYSLLVCASAATRSAQIDL
ncbi:hypothetical protein EON80_30555, partial [bacterium]